MEHRLPDVGKKLAEGYEGWSVEVVIFKVTIPPGMTYNEGVEYDLHEEYTLTAFSEYAEADAYAEKLYKEHTKYPSE